MADERRTNCTYCDHSDMELMRSNGYVEEKYAYCSRHGKVVFVTNNCPMYSGVSYERKKEQKMNHMISQMAAALDEEGK